MERTKRDSAIKLTVGTQHVQICFTIIALASLVNVGLGEYEDASAGAIPLHLNFVRLEKRFLSEGWTGILETSKRVDLHRGRCAIFFRDEGTQQR